LRYFAFRLLISISISISLIRANTLTLTHTLFSVPTTTHFQSESIPSQSTTTAATSNTFLEEVYRIANEELHSDLSKSRGLDGNANHEIAFKLLSGAIGGPLRVVEEGKEMVYIAFVLIDAFFILHAKRLDAFPFALSLYFYLHHLAFVLTYLFPRFCCDRVRSATTSINGRRTRNVQNRYGRGLF
jgi:hypothetical protein